AKTLAEKGLQKEAHDHIDTTTKASFTLTGVKLNTGSQALFYKGIMSTQIPQIRRTTLTNLDKTRHAMRSLNGKTPNDVQIWHSVRNKDIYRTTRGFLWKSLHDAYKIGEFWSRMSDPKYAHRAKCDLCGEEETMEHILLECESSPVNKIVWSQAEELWRKREKDWPTISYGLILGCGLVRLNNARTKKDEGRSRLLTIIISEAAHLIWKIRCERVIQRESLESARHTEDEILKKWIFSINYRLKMDILLTNRFKFDTRATKKEAVVLRTWSGTLLDE
ncbi:hypothetical protein PLICRDRAFT_65879, partial [Plicaturopsis crispa FD-325 SS-3]